MIHLDSDAIEHISYGASVLASGGGGDPYIGKIMAQDAIKKYGPIPLLDIETLQPDSLLLSTGMIGSPSVMIEKIPNSQESVAACRQVEAHLNRKISAIYPIEAGGINSLLPLATACNMRLPVADVDGMGRAFPEFHMTTFHLDGISGSPFVVVNEHLDTLMINASDNYQTETYARVVTVKMGGAAIFAAYPVSPQQVATSGIRGSLSFMLKIGESMQQARESGTNLVDTLISLLGGYLLFRGKATRVLQSSEGGFTTGKACFNGVDEHQGEGFEVFFQNEYLLAQRNDTPLCMTPDLIILLDEDTALPVLTERLRYGTRVVAIGVPADVKWQTPRGIAVSGPAYFKYNCSYTPVSALVNSR